MNYKLLNAAQLITSTLNLSITSPEIVTLLTDTSDLDWPLLVDHADAHSLTPLLYDVWQKAGGLGHIPPDIRIRMARAYADNNRRNSHICRELVEVHHILTDAQVPHLVLKGWPLTERLYQDPAHRVLYDHDFLVPLEKAEAGHQALQAAGFKPLTGQDRWVEKHLAPLWRNNGYEWDGYLFDPDYPRPVELHLYLWEQGWRGLRVESLSHPWREVQSRPVAGRSMQLLSDEDTLIHLAMHFAGHLVEQEARLSQLLDLARFMHYSPYLDWERIWARAAETNIVRFVYASLFLAHQTFGADRPPPNIWRRLAATTPLPLRTWLVDHGSSNILTGDYRRRRRGQDYRLTFLAAQSWQERLGIVRFALLPPVGHLVVKYRLPARWLGPLLYPRYIVERLGTYGRHWLGSHRL